MAFKNKTNPSGIIIGTICLIGAVVFLFTSGFKHWQIWLLLLFLGGFFIENARKGKSVSQIMTSKVKSDYYTDFWYKFAWWSIPVFIMAIIFLLYLKSVDAF